MPTLAQATEVSKAGLSPAAPVVTPVIGGFTVQQYPATPNPFLRCPLPPVPGDPDTLRQYYRGGLVPQDRIMTSLPLSQSPTGGGSKSTAVVSSSSSSSTTTTTTTTIGTVKTASATTPTLAVAQTYTMTIGTSTVFVPLVVTVTGPARVELYGTLSAQMADLFRANTTSPGPGTEQCLLLDVSIDTSPYTWVVTPTLPASNNDAPTQSLSYISITNIAGLTQSITVSIQYLILKL